MSNKVLPEESLFKYLKNKVVVLTGGANGIGASTVKLLHAAGANVVFGDFNTVAGEALVNELNAPASITFLSTNATSYADNVALFETALHKYGRVDHAVACAGIIEQGKLFDEVLTVKSVASQEPTTSVLDINLTGTAYFARIAAVFLRHEKRDGENKSITLLSSAAGFREAPGLTLYQASKHGVMGLMRSARNVLWPRDGVRINCVCPGMTDTQMTAAIIDLFRGTGQAINTPDDVARIVLALQVAEGFYGKAVYVEEGVGWEIEDGLQKTMSQWLGEAPTKRLQDALNQYEQGEAWNIK